VLLGRLFSFLFVFFPLQFWGLNSGPRACLTNALSLGPHLQSVLLWLFWRWGLENYLPWLASNCNPPVSASQVAGITDLSYCTSLEQIFFFF
jgi:hypothetical protein